MIYGDIVTWGMKLIRLYPTIIMLVCNTSAMYFHEIFFHYFSFYEETNWPDSKVLKLGLSDPFLKNVEIVKFQKMFFFKEKNFSKGK
jgi:hypothetical protein